MNDRGPGIVQTERNAQGFKKILVAFDGSEYSIRALRAAEILAKRRAGRVSPSRLGGRGPGEGEP